MVALTGDITNSSPREGYSLQILNYWRFTECSKNIFEISDNRKGSYRLCSNAKLVSTLASYDVLTFVYGLHSYS